MNGRRRTPDDGYHISSPVSLWLNRVNNTRKSEQELFTSSATQNTVTVTKLLSADCSGQTRTNSKDSDYMRQISRT